MIQKIRNDVETIVPYPCHGNSTLKKQFVKGLKFFRWYAPGSPYAIAKALIIVDSDCSDESFGKTAWRRSWSDHTSSLASRAFSRNEMRTRILAFGGRECHE